MPELEGATKWLNSNGARKRDLIGKKPILIHFWSISCDSCKKVMPQLNKLRNDNKGQIHVIAVHMPRSKKDMDSDEVKRAAKKHDIIQPIFIDNEHKLTNAFGVKFVPAYYLFDTDDRLRYSHSGNGGLSMLQKRVDRVLGK